MVLEKIEIEKEIWQGEPVQGSPNYGVPPAVTKTLSNPNIPPDWRCDPPDRSSFCQREFSRKQQALDRVSLQFQHLALPGKEEALKFIYHLYRRNCRPNTLRAYGRVIRLFISYLHGSGMPFLEALTREDLEAFLEHEQDRGLKPVSIKTHFGLAKAFIRFLINQEVVRPEVLSRSIRIKVPELLPKAMDPVDVKQLLSVVSKVRDRAMILVLLRTGMRIGELLSTTMDDLNLRERKINIIQAEKTQVGRVVYFSDDAREALMAWMAERIPQKQFLFYARGRESLTYTAARVMFCKCLVQAGISQKGYTLHCLRHTFASELLNAGMRLECLQQLLGHTNLEVTRRYARLTDRTREDEYFRAMEIIERGQISGHYRLDSELSPVSQEAEPFAAHR
jgi:integrase/recombinase XerD